MRKTQQAAVEAPLDPLTTAWVEQAKVIHEQVQRLDPRFFRVIGLLYGDGDGEGARAALAEMTPDELERFSAALDEIRRQNTRIERKIMHARSAVRVKRAVDARCVLIVRRPDRQSPRRTSRAGRVRSRSGSRGSPGRSSDPDSESDLSSCGCLWGGR